MDRIKKIKTHGFRFSFVDALVLIIGGLGGFTGWNYIGDIAFLIPYVVIHFFLFCNVFRVRSKFELLWAGIFLLNTSIWVMIKNHAIYYLFGLQFIVTIIIITNEIRNPRYRGIFSNEKIIN